MDKCAKQMRPFVPISLAPTRGYRKNRRMITIGYIPRKIKGFFTNRPSL
jgi:hypothetical protein